MDTHSISFDNLPQAVAGLYEELNQLKQLLLKQSSNAQPVQEQLLTAEQAAEFLNLSLQTIYSKVSKGELPVMKQGKRLYFSNLELIDCLKKGKKKSYTEIEAEGDKYLSKKGDRI